MFIIGLSFSRKIHCKVNNYFKFAALTNHGSNVEPIPETHDLKTSEGLKIFNSALHGFDSPLAKSTKIILVPQDF